MIGEKESTAKNKIISFLSMKAAELKIYYSSAAIYVSMINFLMIIATAKKTYDMQVSLFLIIPVGIIIAIIIGWLDYTYIMKHQLKHTNKKNDIKIQLNRIEEKLNIMLEKNGKDFNN